MLFKFVIILLVTVHGLVNGFIIENSEDRNVTSRETRASRKGVTEDGEDSHGTKDEMEKLTNGVTEDGDKVIDKPQDCAAIYLKKKTDNTKVKNGVYTIYPQQGESFRVYCDMTTDGGGWTIIQRRGPFERLENFYRDWIDYKDGFGSLQREFWLGNDKISILTNQDVYNLRFDLEDIEEDTRYATYLHFRVEDESENYRMTCKAFVKGNAGDSFMEHNGMQFTTKDKRHDRSSDRSNCAKKYKGGWWYKNCHVSNLNGKRNSLRFGEGLNWKSWHGLKYSLRNTEMKIRPDSFSVEE